MLMVIGGGAIDGYWSIGKVSTAMPPISMMISAMTHANTGRSIKNLDMKQPCRESIPGSACRGGRRGDRVRMNLGAGDGALQTVDDDPVAVVQAARNHPVG